jgi:hypothetical protein
VSVDSRPSDASRSPSLDFSGGAALSVVLILPLDYLRVAAAAAAGNVLTLQARGPPVDAVFRSVEAARAAYGVLTTAMSDQAQQRLQLLGQLLSLPCPLLKHGHAAAAADTSD